MVSCRDRRHGHSEANRRDLCAVQEVGTEETNGNPGVVKVDEAASSNHSSPVVGTKRGGNGKSSHASRHADTADDEYSSTSEAINGEECQERGQELPGQGTSREDTGHLTAHAKVVLEKDGGVNAD